MPAEIVNSVFCADYFGVYHVPSSSGDETYVITLHGTTSAHCTCPAFRYSRDGNCKHIERVWKEACMWNPQWHDGQACPTMRPTEYTERTVPGERCPSCGGPVVPVRIAV